MASPGCRRGRRPAGLAGLVVLMVAACLAVGPTTPGVADHRQPHQEGSAGADAAARRPNIVLVLTDDMRASELRWMPRVRKLLVDRGARVEGMISNHPMCCPARAELLTGQYAHNSGVHHNNGPDGGYKSLLEPGNHLGRWLERAGYTTGFTGKFLNGWERRPTIPPGWSWFDAAVARIYDPYGLRLYGHGNPQNFRTGYTATVVGRRAVDFVRRHAPEKAPFFLWVNQLAPHDMHVGKAWRRPQPEPRYADAYAGSVSPATQDPAFDERDVSDKPRWIRKRERFPVRLSNGWHRARIRSLRSVDDQVGALVKALRQSGELANTHIVFASDNGYLLGEHRIMAKNVPYEPALQVPFVVRGPGIPRGVVRRSTFELVDVVPTLLQLGGASPGRTLDGRSMLPALRRDAPGKSFSLIQGGSSDAAWWWRGVRSGDYKYVRYASGYEELYDLREDPSELRNVARRPRYGEVLGEYSQKLDILQRCSGASCLAETS